MNIEGFELLDYPGEPKNFPLDPFQEKVFANIYIEFPVRDTLFMLSPALRIVYPGKNQDVEREIIKRETKLYSLKRLILESIIEHTALLEANSYYIAQNDYLLLARITLQPGEGIYRLKFYTHDAMDLLTNYEDKIYLGHDFLYLTGKRKFFGLDDFIPYLDSEFAYLKEKEAEFKIKNPLVRDYMVEIGELIGDVLMIWEEKKIDFDIEEAETETLRRATMNFMDVKHILVELHDEIREFEYRLRSRGEAENHLSRYVTKLRKDVVNILHYINMKLLSRIQRRINFPG